MPVLPVRTPQHGKHTMPKHQMLISYQPGEECRVAIVEDGVLEDYHTERPATANRVNNLYLGKVTNIESSLQAAFVDFGGPESAFLHTSDIHPMYFPEEDGETTEKIGKKTARRDRPPIQQCLKRGVGVIGCGGVAGHHVHHRPHAWHVRRDTWQ